MKKSKMLCLLSSNGKELKGMSGVIKMEIRRAKEGVR